MQFDFTEQIERTAKEQAALPPPPPTPVERSAWGAIPRGIAGAAAQVAAQVQQLSAGTDERYAAEQDQMRGPGSRQAASARQSAAGLDARGDQLAEFERGLRPDPATATTAEQVVYGLTRSLTKAGAAMVTMGPVAGAAAFGASEGAGTFDDLKRDGVDTGTAAKAAAAAGAAATVGVALPMMGSTLARTAALYVAGGPGGFVAQQQATRSILERADYAEQAQKFDPFDPVGLALSALVPLPFAGYGALRNIRAGKKTAPGLPDQAPRADQPVANTEGAAVADVPAARAAQDHIDAALAHNLTLTRQALDAQAPVIAEEAARRLPSLAEFTAAFKAPKADAPAEVKSDFLGWLQTKGGIDFAEKFDISGEKNAIRANPAGIFRKGGQPTDTLAWAAVEDGYLTPGAGAREFVVLVQQALRGEKVLNFDQQQAAARRAGWEADLAEHVSTLQRRLELLGVDPEQAKGNAQAMEAYLRENHDKLLAARIAEEADAAKAASLPDLPARDATPQIEAARQAAQDLRDSGDPIETFVGNRPDLPADVRNLLVGMYEAGQDTARADRMLADFARTVAQQRQRPAVDVAADVVEASRQGKTVTPEPAAPVAAKPEEAAAASAGNRLQEIVDNNPSLVVRITEDGKPVTVADELAALRREVAEGTETELGALDADLVRVAAECALTTATA